MKTKLVSLLLFIFALQIQAQHSDTISVFSKSMNKSVKNRVILPESYNKTTKYPVVYLLHGYGGSYNSWIYINPNLGELASLYHIIIVCPDGQNSWYWDSPIDKSLRYETYVSQELISFIDNAYSTIKSRNGRAITGFSMGGHGGLWLGFNHPDVFGACGSMSGGVDIRPFPNNWDMRKSLGNYADNKSTWDNYTVINQIEKIAGQNLAIIIDCGVDDFFYDVNMKLHEKMLYMKIPHDFTIRPGKHDDRYWNNAVEYQLLFFSSLFRK